MHLLCTWQRVTSAWSSILSGLPAWILYCAACSRDMLYLRSWELIQRVSNKLL